MLFKLSRDNKVCKDNAKKVLGKKFFKEFSEKKDTLQLDIHLPIYLKNVILSMICLKQKIYFLEYISICDKKGIKGKNNVQRDLSACVVQKFNGYEILKIQLRYRKMKS